MIETREIKGFVLVDKDSDIIALDRDSGGYPYKSSGPWNWHVFNNVEEALSYRKVFRNDSAHWGDWRIAKISYSLDIL